MSIVLARDRNGREILWKCTTCGQPFNLGWGSECNACITAERRHRELLKALDERIQRRIDRREEIGI